MPAPAAAATGFPTTVLVVDDEQTVIDVLSAVLKKHKLETKGALSGEEALELMKTHRYGCLITDKNLPGKGGLEVIKEARKLQPYCACLVMTGYPTAESVLEALRLGATDYLEKPFPELGLVVQRITHAMDHSRTAFEREALVRMMRDMRTRLKKSEEAVFQRQTELDVFVQVLELRVEEATQALVVKNAQLQGQLDAAQKKSGGGDSKAKELAEAVKAAATRAGMAAQRPNLTLDDAREALKTLEKALLEATES